MQKKNPVIKNYILSSQKHILDKPKSAMKTSETGFSFYHSETLKCHLHAKQSKVFF